jgi:polar amino acid transport system ATP-binding protein
MSQFSSGSLEAKGIHLAFGSNRVLRGIDLNVPAGTTASVIGPSGSGKSTLLRVMNRLIEPDQGDILLDGKSVLEDNPDELRRRIGMVFQQFNLFPHMTVGDNVAFALRKLRKLPKDQARDEALEQLDLVGLKHKAGVRPATLSGGQQQRLAIARAVINRPSLLLDDEPTGNVDDAMALRLMRLFEELNRLGTTIVIATHNEALAARSGRPRLRLAEGELVQERAREAAPS